MLNKGQVWRQIQAKLAPGMAISTWSEQRGIGPEFKVDVVDPAFLLITPTSTGKQRRLVQNSFDEMVDYQNAGGSRSELETRNSSYSLGILKYLELI